MPSPPPRPSSPIPFRRRAQTMDQAWPPSHHPYQGFLSLDAIGDNSSPEPEPAAEERIDPFFTTDPANGPLHVVDTMRLQVVRDQNENALGMRVIDPNNTMGKDANICAPLPLGPATTGIAFSVGSPHGMHEAYTRATQITDSQRIVGVMFAPVKEQGMARDVDWSFLEQAKNREKDPAPKPATGRSHGKGHGRSRRRHTTANEFGESSKPKSQELDKSDESEVEDTGTKIHHKIKEMVLEDKNNDN
ncbi:hypothetical protein FLAG1_10423 [Fusarium langsethiae]|uniref:Uncharacterized protein n=1 Tax=Fusarium langsethiae TaxID=179993 RepID=A0A0M9ENR3_FUSLA|nr:hypothetical protein FLAG1_10423 [Fusarium langsethiae]GKU07890.1 unnamed protein product [Fusarium langsethiae]